MKEFIIDTCKWYLDAEMDDTSKLDAIEKFKSRYEPLLGFLFESQSKSATLVIPWFLANSTG